MYRGQRNKLNNRKETVGQIQNEGHPTGKKKKKEPVSYNIMMYKKVRKTGGRECLHRGKEA